MMNNSKNNTRPGNFLGRAMGRFLAICLMLGFGFAELSAQDLANFVNTIIQDGETTITNDVTVEPGESFTLQISVEAGDLEVNNVTVSMMYDATLLTANSATDLAAGLLPIPLGGPNPQILVMDMGGVSMGQVRWAKGDLFGNPPSGTFNFLSINFTANAEIDVNTMTEIFHLTNNVAASLIIQPADGGVAADITGEIPSVNVFIDAGVVAVDCPELDLNIGDACDDDDDDTENDVVGDDCVCAGTPVVVEFDCPELEANIGDACDDDDDDTENDVVGDNCVCAGTPVVVEFDCPELEANIGDACDDDDDDTENDVVGDNCVCAGTPVVVDFDCPELEANIGDACDDDDDDTENDVVGTDCVCAGTPVVVDFDCPELEANIGDACDDDDDDTENDVVGTDCVCAGTPVVVDFDCPELEANIGDACDDDDDDTENDVVGDNCVCAGTPVVVDFDCPELEANIGDTCDDDDDDTENDVVGADCGCAGTPIVVGDCNNYVYYLADHTFPEDISDLYRVDIVDGNAELTYIATCPDEVHIAFNEANGLVYAIRKDDGAIKSIDPTADSPEYSDALAVDASFSQITQAVFSQDGKLLVSSSNQDIIYSIDVMNGNAVTVFDSYSPIEGGDLAYAIDGSALYMATREGNGGLYSVMMEGVGPDVFIASLPSNVTGLATMESGNLLISANGNSSLLVKNTAGADVTSLPLTLNGESFTLNDGDMASGCAGNELVEEECNYKLYQTNQPSGGSYTLYETTLNGDGTATVNTLLTGLSNAHVALSPNGSTIYILGNDLKTYDVATGTITSTVAIQSLSGQTLTGFPATVAGSDGTIYAARQNQVYTIALDGTATPFGPNRNVSGGDLVFVDGELWIITRNNNTFTNVLTGASFVVPVNEINGAATLENGNVLLSDGNGAGLLKEVDLTSMTVVATYETGLTLNNGDLAGGCIGPELSFEDGGECYATEVIEYVEGSALNGGSIAMNRTDATKALGEPERIDELVFVSLGYGGSLTLGFDGSVENGEGNDIEVVETTYGNSSCASYDEFADVFVSQDGSNFFFVKTICRADAMVDISDAQGTSPLAFINYVRIVNNNELSNTPDAFDVDGVVAIPNCIDLTSEGESENAGLVSTITSYPNPTPGNSQVVFVAAETSRTLVEVYDMNGRNVATLFNQVAEKGLEYRLDFNGAALPNGVYIYRMTNNNETLINKFMIAK